MTAILGAQEFCGKGHLRTPASTYVSPNGKRHCRLCSGKMASGAGGQGRPSEQFTAKQLKLLRYLVRCVHCGAVPTEQYDEDGAVLVREVSDGNGGTTTLPYVVTPHAEDCVGSTKIGRPRQAPKTPQFPAGPCEHCGVAMTASVRTVKTKRFCNAVCRKATDRQKAGRS